MARQATVTALFRMNQEQRPRISICIPHWRVKPMMSVCLRSIRKHSENYDSEIIVVDNGSNDDSLDYLRSLKWIRLIERPDETPENWPANVFTAWDCGIKASTGEFYITMHSDVFVHRDDWLDPFLERMSDSDKVAGVGAWKLELRKPLYSLQKRVIGYALATTKQMLGLKKTGATWQTGHYPRDYCAMYRSDPIREHNMTFCALHGKGGGYSIARQLWDAGYETRLMPVPELVRRIVHVAHGTAGMVAEKPLNHARAQCKVERKVKQLFAQDWVRSLQCDASLDN
jgi:glycosyltransferase involved in cell wall biosynthesis